MSDEIEMLDMNDPDFAQKFSAALGVQPGDTLEIRTPQFERTDGVVPAILGGGWDGLRSLSVATLKILGCGRWDEPDEEGKVLMLFPKEWYPHIPTGYVVEDIFGETEKFKPGETDDDYRFGCLSFGVRVTAALKEQSDGE